MHVKIPIEIFAATGWRVGWLIAPKSIIQPTLAATTRIVFCTNSPLQEAAAAGVEEAHKRGFLKTQLREYSERRDILVNCFDDLGLRYTLPEGTYFILLVRMTLSRCALTQKVYYSSRTSRTSPGRMITPSLILSRDEGGTSGVADLLSGDAFILKLFAGHVGSSRWKSAFPRYQSARSVPSLYL